MVHRQTQIDGLRALAIIGVLYTHFWSVDSASGHLGVRLFFMISGFLITGQLLRAKEDIASGARGFGSSVIAFYARRALRIFPAYYALLAIYFAFNLEGFRSTAIWHAAYLSNLLDIVRHSYNEPWIAAHLWTLSVEAQFYMVWPFLILLTPARAIRPVIAASIVAALAYRGACAAADVSVQLRLLAPMGELDALAVGALLATYHPGEAQGRIWLVAAFAALAVTAVTGFHGQPWLSDSMHSLALLPMLVLLDAAREGRSPVLATLLANSAATRLGRLSYGVYLFHLLAWLVLGSVGRKAGYDLFSRGPVTFVLVSALTWIFAEVSWRMIEQPGQRLKEHVRGWRALGARSGGA